MKKWRRRFRLRQLKSASPASRSQAVTFEHPMRVRNVHYRNFAVEPEALGSLLDTLSSPDDRIWPGQNWPKLRFDRPLGVGAAGGHGPIRYVVEAYEPGVSIGFRFTGPAGFDGTHTFAVEPLVEGARLTHVISMDTSGRSSLSWPLLYRPLHDALVEDALDRAAAAVGEPLAAPPWSIYVRLLRAIARGRNVTMSTPRGTSVVSPSRRDGGE